MVCALTVVSKKYVSLETVCLLLSPPVHLCAPPVLFELKAGNLQDAEETVAHHAGNGVIHAEKALSKPVERQEKNKPRSSDSAVKINGEISLNAASFCLHL